MYLDLKESTPHGTPDYSYSQYHITKIHDSIHVPVHWHDELEIIYVVKGNLHVYIDGNNFDAGKGDIFFAGPKVLHYMDTQDFSVEYYAILFPLDFISFRTEDCLESKFFAPLKKGKLMFPMKLKPTISIEIAGYLNRIIHENTSDYLNNRLKTKILILEMLTFMLENNTFEIPAYINSSGIQREIISYIQQHHTEKITLEMLSKEFHLSEKYLSRYFKVNFAIPFKQYVCHLRLSTAKNLLTSTDLSITDVAMNSGFPSVNLFIRTFKSAFGITPLQYRKKS